MSVKKVAKKIESLNDSFIIKLQSLYDVETELVKALPKLAAAANDKKLKKGLNDHLKETKEHARRLERIFKLIDRKATKTKVEAIRGLVTDANWIIKQKPEKSVLDSMIIASVSYVEHYEMSGYMSAMRWALKLGLVDVADILELTLNEEVGAAEGLGILAETSVDDKSK